MKGGEEGGGDGGIGRNKEGKREKEMRGEGERERGRGGDEETGRQREMAQSAERRAQAICTFMSLVEATCLWNRY